MRKIFIINISIAINKKSRFFCDRLTKSAFFLYFTVANNKRDLHEFGEILCIWIVSVASKGFAQNEVQLCLEGKYYIQGYTNMPGAFVSPVIYSEAKAPGSLKRLVYGFGVGVGVGITAGVGDGVPPGVGDGVLLRLMERSSKLWNSTVVPPVFK